VDTGSNHRNRAPFHGFAVHVKTLPSARGRSVDTGQPIRSIDSCENRVISREFVKPSNGLEPLTPSLPSL
jgi:hypothetical protein